VEQGVGKNPIRRIVTMLQNLQKKVEAEGEAAADLHKKFLCQCETGVADLTAGIADAEAKGSDAAAASKEGSAQKAQLEQDLASHKADRQGAKDAIATATSIRDKEAADFATYSAEATANLDAMAKAIAAIEKGSAGSFLQTGAADVLRQLVQSKRDMNDGLREEVTAFLSEEQGEEQSGEILGVLKQLSDEFTADLKAATATEDAAIKSFDDLVAAKKKEIDALTAAIEDKSTRLGEVGVQLAELSNAGGDAAGSLEDNKKFLGDLKAKCARAQDEYDAVTKERGQELVALADTIKFLNDDDALELFKKTLPSASASFLQVQQRQASMQASALSLIRGAKSHRFDFIALALHGGKGGMEKVVKMIDTMVVTLKTEQKDDDAKKDYCAAEFDSSDDKKKALERSVSDDEKAMDDAKESLATLADEIKALQKAIVDLDKSVAEATEQRKEENSAHQELMASNTAAKELIGVAKNRMNKFYNPKLYKAPPKRELTEEERIAVNMGETLAPTPAPGGIAGTGISALQFTKKAEEATGVIALMDMLIAELDKEMTVSSTDEKDAQADYETAMEDSKAKRADDSKTLEDKQSAHADTEGALQGHKDDHTSNSKGLMETNKYIAGLHGECDWLVQNFDQRKEARAGEIDALGKAKAVLSGADYSLLQTRSLRGHM
jgi:chromosome segregation ATPase